VSYKTLLVHLELGHPNTALLTVTATLAERLHARVVGIAVCQPMRIIYSDGYVPSDIIEQDRKQIDDEIGAAEAEFRSALSNRVPNIEWRSEVTYKSLSEHLASQAACADLVITGVEASASMFDTSRHVDVGDLVMEAGRPCLIVPAAKEELPLKHIVVGWKDSSETRRAIRDALPLLTLAERVTILEVIGKDDADAARAGLADVAGWMKTHGIEATPMVAPATGDDAARLNEIVGELGGDLLVAGAYGHSRVREWALGGVTRDLLLRAGRCALVSH
jgi:nucleotide-binding universal stress UspA family protein